MDPRALKKNIRALKDFHIRTRTDQRDMVENETAEVFFGNQKEFEALLELGNFVEVAPAAHGRPPIPTVGEQPKAAPNKVPEYLAAATKFAQDQAMAKGIVEGAQRCQSCDKDMLYTGDADDGTGKVVARKFVCDICKDERHVPVSIHAKAAAAATGAPRVEEPESSFTPEPLGPSEPEIPPLIEDGVGADPDEGGSFDDTSDEGGEGSVGDTGRPNGHVRRSLADTA
jgi:hypothetical protein